MSDGGIAEIALRIIVSGRVQGVGFRYFTEGLARQLGLKGWVRNLPNGSVEVQVAGPEAAVQDLMAGLRRGPTGSHVKTLSHEELGQAPSWDRFDIVY